MVLYFVLLWLCFCFWWLLGFAVVDVLCWYYHLIVLVFVTRAVGCVVYWFGCLCLIWFIAIG